MSNATGYGGAVLGAAERGIETLARIGAWMAGISVVAIVGLVVAEIVAREVFSTSIFVSVEYSSYLLVALTFLGLAYTQRAGSMIYVGLAYDRARPRLRTVLDAVRSAVALCFGVLAIYYVGKFTLRSFELAQVSMTFARTPLWIPQSVMVLGLVLVTLEWLRLTLVAIVRLLKGGREAEA